MARIISQQLIDFVLSHHFELGMGIHGIDHWKRVEANGWMLCRVTGADLEVVRLFAWLHDSCRMNNGFDPQHGPRAARLARELNGKLFELDAPRLELLCTACERHTVGRTHGNITIATCWDSDRLDLVRIGVEIDPEMLATDAARDPLLINAAADRFLTDARHGLRFH